MDHLRGLIVLLTSGYAAVDPETCGVQEHGRGDALMQARSIHYSQRKQLQLHGQDECEEKMVRIGVGGCMEQTDLGLQIPGSLGWSKCTCNTETPQWHYCYGACPNLATCEAECLANPECGGYSWVERHCWMFKKMLMPAVIYNDRATWYTCYAKERCCPNQCCPPFKGCGAWGDPHFTNTFYQGDKLFDFMGVGLFEMAASKDKSFQLQAFFSPYNKNGVSIFVGFALKVAGYNITIIGKNVSVNGVRYTSLSGSHPSGLELSTVFSEGDKVTVTAGDNCVHFKSTFHEHKQAPNNWYNNMMVYLADEVASTDGLCGAASNTNPTKANNSIFSDDELKYLCDLANMTDCEEQSPPDGWKPINSPEEACETEGISYEEAEYKCDDLRSTESFFKACIFDYCASGGNEELVDNAKESRQEDPPPAVKKEDEGDKCTRPFKNCAAWGDPHYTASFFGEEFDWQGVGVFTLATSSAPDNFELQAFQCPWAGKFGTVFAGFAMKVDGTRITIIQDNVTINGKLLVGTSHPVGVSITSVKTPRDTVHLHSKNNCLHFKINVLHTYETPYYYHDMFLDLAEQVATKEGICGSDAYPPPLTRDSTLFSASELDSLCQKCNMTDCQYLTPPEGWDPPANAIEACDKAGMSIDVATSQCKQTLVDTSDPTFLTDCVYDLCASSGDQSMAQNAGDSQQEGIDRNMEGSV